MFGFLGNGCLTFFFLWMFWRSGGSLQCFCSSYEVLSFEMTGSKVRDDDDDDFIYCPSDRTSRDRAD